MARSVLEGRVAVVTGAARGVGAALSHTLAARGARVALVGLEPDELKAVSAGLPGESAHWHADVTDPAAMAEVAEEVRARFGGVDILVANAGVATGGAFAQSDPDTWRRVIEVNLIGSAVTCRAFLPALTDRKGYFLQIASLAAITPNPTMSAYCASKSGVEAFAHCLRPEVAPLGVRVGVAYLSWTDTDMVRGGDADPVLADLRRRMPWPFNRTYPLAPAVRRLARGIERRSAHVYGQRWLSATVPIRGLLPAVINAQGTREMRRYLPRLTASGDLGLAGVGGAAARRDDSTGE